MLNFIIEKHVQLCYNSNIMEKEKKSARNKTIDLSAEEGHAYLERCIQVNDQASLPHVLDKTILGDSFAVMPKLPAGFADLIICDPPYNLSKDFGGNRFKATSEAEYFAYTRHWLDWKNSMEDIWFVTKSDSYTFHTEAVKLRRRVIAPYRVNGKPKDWEETEEGNFRNTCPSNFWDDISVPFWSMPENTAHPTQKPEKLLAKLILASSDVGDIVFDPFLGSGSSSVTAKKLGRHFVGIEQNEQYCVWAEKRLADAEFNKTIQGFADGVFWERNTRK